MQTGKPQSRGRGGHRGSGMVPFEKALMSSYKPSIHIIPLSTLVCPKFQIAVFTGGGEPPNFGGRRGRRGSERIPFERALVSFYRPSITFPLSLRVSEILPLLFSSMPLFPYHTSSLPKIPPCSPGNRRIAFSLQRAKVLC